MTSNMAVLLLRVILIVALLFILTTFAHAASCRMRFNDIGTIVGVGGTKSDAFSDAALNCFSAYDDLHRRLHNGHRMEGDEALAVIDICVNKKCEK